MPRSKRHVLVRSPKTSLAGKSCAKWSCLRSVLLPSPHASKRKKCQNTPKGTGYTWILSQRQKNLVSFRLGSKNGKAAGCGEAEGRREERGPVAGCPRYGSRAGNPAVAAATPHLRCTEGACGVAASFSGFWIDLAQPEEEGFTPCPQSPDRGITNTQRPQPQPPVSPAQALEGRDNPGATGTRVFARDAPSPVSAWHLRRIGPPGEPTDRKAPGTTRQGLTQQSLEEFTLKDVRDFSNGGF